MSMRKGTYNMILKSAHSFYKMLLFTMLKLLPERLDKNVFDQGHTPALGGAYLATHEFLNSQLSLDFVPIYMSSGQMFLVKISDEQD